MNSITLSSSQDVCRQKIINQIRKYEPDEEIQTTRNRIYTARVEQNKLKLYFIRSNINSEQVHNNNLNLETGASDWLTTLPLKQEGYVLTKQLFWDRIPI